MRRAYIGLSIFTSRMVYTVRSSRHEITSFDGTINDLGLANNNSVAMVNAHVMKKNVFDWHPIINGHLTRNAFPLSQRCTMIGYAQTPLHEMFVQHVVKHVRVVNYMTRISQTCHLPCGTLLRRDRPNNAGLQWTLYRSDKDWAEFDIKIISAYKLINTIIITNSQVLPEWITSRFIHIV